MPFIRYDVGLKRKLIRLHAFSNLGDFYAILLTNIYRSEKYKRQYPRDHERGGGAILVGDHVSLRPLEHRDNFSKHEIYRGLIKRLIRADPRFCAKVASSPATFNPVRDVLRTFSGGQSPSKAGQAPDPYERVLENHPELIHDGS